MCFLRYPMFTKFVMLAMICMVAYGNVLGQCAGAINTFPHVQDFEAGNGGWVASGTGSDWVWGAPSKPVIAGAAASNKCWITGGLTTSFYSYGQRSMVESPCYDLSALTLPHVEVSVFWETEKQYDGATLQYSIDGGSNWSNVGAFGDAVDCLNSNWYNAGNISGLSGLTNIKHGWAGNIQPTIGSCQGGSGSGAWVIARHTMPYLAGKNNVRFRFIFGAGTVCNGFDGFAFDNFTLSDAPAPLTLSTAITAETCVGNDGTITGNITGGTAPYTSNWNQTPAAGFSATGLLAGPHPVVVTDSNGCTKNFTVTVPASPLPTVTLSESGDTCAGGLGVIGSAVTNGTAPYAYLWSNGQQSAQATQLTAGNYDIIITDASGCTATAAAIVGNVNNFSISLGSNVRFCPGQPIGLSPGPYNDILWSNGSTQTVLQINEAGTYWVQVTDPRGCIATDSIEVWEDCLSQVLLPNAFTPNSDGINDFFGGLGVAPSHYVLRIYNRWGVAVFETNDLLLPWNGTYQQADCPQGLYAWRMAYAINQEEAVELKGTVMLLR